MIILPPAFPPAASICALAVAQNGVSQGAICPKSRAIESTNSGNPSATPTISLRRLAVS